MTSHPIETWHRLVRTQDPSGLDALLADDVVFHSPVVHTPQRGKPLAAMYLGAAFQWNDDGQIVDFKVMIRPLKAINVIQQRMAAMLQVGAPR